MNNNMPYMGCMLPTSYKTLTEALALVKDAVQGEREDELFYDYLISIAPTKEEKDIISTIRDDERKHNKMFRQIYRYFTGQEIPPAKDEGFERPKSYIEGITKALFGELAAMERYRIIRAGMPDRYHRDMVFEILTDEMKHADKYNYMLNRNVVNPINDKLMSRSSNSAQKTPDEWVMYIEPLVKRALAESEEGINMTHLFQEFILSGVLVGRGMTPQEAIEQVEVWEKTGESKLLQASKMKK